MALGLPVVSTDCLIGGLSVIINNNENGIIVPVGDEKAMAAAIERIVNDPVLSAHLSGNARKVLQEFSSRSIAEMWLSYIEDVLTC